MLLLPPAMQVIKKYLTLPIPGHNIPCPYYNNRRQNVHGGLRVLIGKGSPSEIAAEAELIALREKVNLKNFTDEQVKKFLVNNHVGVDCSALAYHILDAELQARGLGRLSKHLNFLSGNFARRLLTRFRPVENASVEVFASEKNSRAVALADVHPGDMIIFRKFGEKKDRDHVLIVHETDENLIKYTHALQWSSDGLYNHGVRQGEIRIIDNARTILEQEWMENNKTEAENETFVKAKQAVSAEVRRILWL